MLASVFYCYPDHSCTVFSVFCRPSPRCSVGHPHGLWPRAEPPVQEALLLLSPAADAYHIIAVRHQLQRGFITQ